jgi:hypothetical protein
VWINSCQKGKRGEREAAKAVAEALGIAARRGQQFSGLEGEDIVTDLDGVHFEVKRTERLNLYAAMQQATLDASVDDVPVVLHRKNKQQWVAIVPLDQLTKLAELIRNRNHGTDRDGEKVSDP